MPHTLHTVADKRTTFPLLNFTYCAQVLPRGMSLADISPFGEREISVFDTEGPPSSVGEFDQFNPAVHELTKMIATTPSRQHWRQAALWMLRIFFFMTSYYIMAPRGS